MGTEIFFGKPEIRLDTPVNKQPDGQITARRREQNPPERATAVDLPRAASEVAIESHPVAEVEPPLRGMIRILLEFARDQMVQR